MLTISKDHEEDIAALLSRNGFGAKTQPGSGNRDYNPNDVKSRDANLMVECKCTEAKTMKIELAWLKRVIDKSLEQAKRGVLAIRFKEGAFPARMNDYAVIPMSMFVHLLQCEREVSNAQQS